MNLDVDSFWNLVADSRLLNENQIDAFKTKWPDEDARKLSQRLEKEKILSPLQSEVLLAGSAGPFLYGRYLVLDKSELEQTSSTTQKSSNPTSVAFEGRDLRTTHPVKLDFFNGQTASALTDWKALEKRVRELSNCRHPNLLETYQSISLPDYRFVVSEVPSGKRLSEKLPHKVRLKLDEAAPIALQVAMAIESQLDAGVAPMLPPAEQLPPHIWVGKSASAKIEPFWEIRQKDSGQSPLKVVVSLLLRMAGNDYGQLENLSVPIGKAGITGELEQIIRKTFETSDEDTFQQSHQPGGLQDLITALKAICPKITQPSLPPTTVAFRSALDKSTELTTQKDPDSVQPVPEIDPDAETLDSKEAQPTDDPRVLAAREAADLKRKGRWKVPAAIALSLAAMTAIMLVWATSGETNVISQTDPEPKQGTIADATDSGTSTDSGASPTGTVADTTNNEVKTDYSNVAYVQEIVDDAPSRLWQSPTTGKPIDFRYVPAATEILLHVRPASLMQSPSGARLFNGLQKTFAQPIQTMQQAVGLSPEKISAVTISLYPGQSQKYDAIYRVETTKEVSLAELKSSWGDTDEVKTKEGDTIYSGDENVYLIVSPNPSDAPKPDSSISFVTGPPRLVQELAMQGGVTVLSRPLQRLAEKTDRDRHLTLLTTPRFLTGEYGRTLWGEAANTIVPELRIFFPDEVSGFSLGLHSDNGEYLELQIDQTQDATPEQLAKRLEKQIRSTLQEVASFASELPSIPYWDRVRQRIKPMADQLAGDLRWGVESKHVMANAWLPPDATQNIVAASELTLAFANSAAAQVADADKEPQNIEELLATKRSLNIANPPDLNILLSQIASDINDDFPRMPFEFKISLKGNDLQKEGITQNQRPSALAFKDLSVADILTQIMTKANPDKDISGPADANCKLVWVVVKDEGTGNSSVVITTRAAATARGDSLPPAFVIKPK